MFAVSQLPGLKAVANTIRADVRQMGRRKLRRHFVSYNRQQSCSFVRVRHTIGCLDRVACHSMLIHHWMIPVGSRALFLLLQVLLAQPSVLEFGRDFGGVSHDASPNACQRNSKLLTSALQHNASNNTLRFAPNDTFYFHYGVHAKHISHVILQIDGVLRFQRPPNHPYNILHSVPS